MKPSYVPDVESAISILKELARSSDEQTQLMAGIDFDDPGDKARATPFVVAYGENLVRLASAMHAIGVRLKRFGVKGC